MVLIVTIGAPTDCGLDPKDAGTFYQVVTSCPTAFLVIGRRCYREPTYS